MFWNGDDDTSTNHSFLVLWNNPGMIKTVSEEGPEKTFTFMAERHKIARYGWQISLRGGTIQARTQMRINGFIPANCHASYHKGTFLANVNSRSRLLYALARPSVVCLSVTFVHPTQAVQIFGNISTALGTLATHWHPLKISRRYPRGTPPSGELNTIGVAKYIDFGPIDGYMSETVQDRR